ncbi:MAG: murein peptide amidase A [Gammaproteobacteria bacterium]|nr:murein peptide amidase A [Gammaproteobacteria bacterium]
MNPDGALIKKLRRLNANGIDLNRNFNSPSLMVQHSLTGKINPVKINVASIKSC